MGTRIFISGGGTGGHVYPGLSVAEALLAVDPALDIHYVGRDESIEARLVLPTGLPFHGIHASGLRGMGWGSRLKFLLNFILGLVQSLSLMLFKRPNLVLGCGGYVSAPVLAAARLLGIPCCLQEQNAMPGSTNRFTGKWVKRAYLGFAGAEKYFPAGSPVVTGNPVRASFTNALAKVKGQGTDDGPSTRKKILIFGGSLGARTLNQAVIEAAPSWSKNEDMEFVIQTGTAMEQEVAGCYEKLGAKHVQVLAYIEDMPSALLRANLVVCRAGASTLAELQVVGKPSILVPFPHATDDHQLRNAHDMAEAGAAVVLEDHQCSGESLLAVVGDQFATRGRLEEMGKASAAMARPRAAQKIALDILFYCNHAAGQKADTKTDSAMDNSSEDRNSVS